MRAVEKIVNQEEHKTSQLFEINRFVTELN